MAYDVLRKLERTGKLVHSLLLVADRNSLDGKRRVPGSLVREVQRSFISIDSGETGHETLRIPLDRIIEIRSGRRIVFRKGKRIERIYPR